MNIKSNKKNNLSFIDNREETQNIIDYVLKVISSIVGSTIGPKGSFVIGNFDSQNSQIINDGVTIINNINFKDEKSKAHNLILDRIKSASQNVNEMVGDGTSTCAIMISKLYEIGMQYSKLQHPVLIAQGMKLALKRLLSYIENNSLTIETTKDIVDIATVSSRRLDIGKMIGEAIEKIGKNGSIICTEGNTMETTLEVNAGFKMDCGVVSPMFLKKKNKINFKNARVLITNYIISNIEQLVKIIEVHNQIVSTSEDNGLVVFVNDLSGSALQLALAAIQNRNLAFIKLSSVDEEENINDLLSVLSSNNESYGKFFDKTKFGWDKLDSTFFISAEHLEISLRNTIIISNNFQTTSPNIKSRIKELEDNLKNSDLHDFQIKKIKERINRLSGGVANIRIGGVNEKEIKDTKYLIQDAICATQSAINGGVVCGGGLFYMELAEDLKIYMQELEKENISTGILDGIKTVIESLYVPFQYIIKNNNISFDYAADKLGINHLNILKKFDIKDKYFGFNAEQNTFCNLLQNGIKEAAKTHHRVLSNSISLVTSLIQTNSILIPEDDEHGMHH